MYRLEEGIAENDEECIELKSKLETSEIELLPNHDYTDVLIHPLNVKK